MLNGAGLFQPAPLQLKNPTGEMGTVNAVFNNFHIRSHPNCGYTFSDQHLLSETVL